MASQRGASIISQTILPRQNKLRRFCKRRNRSIGRHCDFLFQSAIDKNAEAAGGLAGQNIAPTVAHDVTRFQIDVVRRGGFQQHARLWLSAKALVGIQMKADFDVINRNSPPEFGMHRLDGRSRRDSRGHVWLVCHNDDEKTCLFGTSDSVFNARKQVKLCQ